MANAATGAIAALASRQHGVVARWQLVQMGLSSALIRSRILRGDLIPVPGYRGIYAVGHQAISRGGYLMSATLAHRALLSHGSAAELWGLRGRSRPIEVTRKTKGGAAQGVVVHRSRNLGPIDRATYSRIPVTSVPRTLADISTRLTTKQLERAVTAAERQKLLDWTEMDAFLGRRQYGTAALREVLGRADPRAVEVSEGLEELFLELWMAGPRPEPVAQALVEGLRVDFLWPSAMVIVECDSYRYHSGRLKQDEDSIRDMVLETAGYKVHRATHYMLTAMPDRFIALVQQSILKRTSPRTRA